MTIPQTRVAFLPFGPKLLKSLKPRPWVLLPRTLGEHLKKRRLESGLLQRDLRVRFKLEKETYANWEKDRRSPAMKHWPAIIEFLGYDPASEPKTIGERLLAYRRRHGLSRVVLARISVLTRLPFGAGRLVNASRSARGTSMLLSG